MTDVDAIRWLRLSDDEIVRLRATVGDVMRARPEVVAAYHYGSSARRQPARDVDIGLVVERSARASVDVEGIAVSIASRSGLRADAMDVRVINDADPVFLGNLLREGQRCFERDREARIAFEVQAMNAWLDFQPVWNRLRRRVLDVWAHG